MNHLRICKNNPWRLVASALFLTASGINFAVRATAAVSPNPALIEAVSQGNLVALQTALDGTNVNEADGNGKTALMVAAEKGQFECAKELLWHGADPLLADKKGRIALDWLDLQSDSYLVNNLLLRCYALVKKQGSISRKPVTPGLVLINDNFVDFNNPAIKPHYHVNARELNGEPGKDDDGNGFIDDIYGWRIEEDSPIEPADVPLANAGEEQQFAIRLLGMVEAASGNEQSQKAVEAVLSQSYENPFVRRIGFDNMLSAGLDFNDLRYAAMLAGASHGTHVAGIVLKESQGRAQVHCLSIGRLGSPDLSPMEREETLRDLAFQSATFTEYVDRLLDKVRDYSLGKGKRSSDYIRQLSCGVVNLSWGLPRSQFEKSAEKVTDAYRQYGQDPRTIADFKGPTGRSRSTDLGLELMACNAAAFALACYENPNVLFVVSAGNEEKDNDVDVCSPQYLSRFFPNVITVASLDAQGGLSKFSNYGLKSVQIAAPGEDISSNMLYGATGFKSGTSMAAPAVSGAAALLRMENPGLSAVQIRDILETTASQSAELQNKVTTSGRLQTDLALRVAREWPTPASLVASLEAGLRSVPDKGIPAVSNHSGRNDTRDPFIVVDQEQSGWGVSTLGGFGNSWRVVLASGSESGRQMICGPDSFPASFVLQHRAEGYGIAAVAGESDGWSVLLSKNVPSQQTMIGYSLDLPAIATRLKQGLRVRSLGGWKNHWIAVMDGGTGWGGQIIIPPAPLDDSQKQLLAAKMKEGYAITSIAGDDVADNDEDGWAFVLTKGAPFTRQLISDPGEWPGEWIAEQNAKGFRITGATGYGTHWVVVMSKTSSPPAKELISAAGEFPAAWLRHPEAGTGSGLEKKP